MAFTRSYLRGCVPHPMDRREGTKRRAQRENSVPGAEKLTAHH